MTEDERIARLAAVLKGTGATVNDAFGIWALGSQLADHHVAQLAGWADLQFLIAGSCRITDASLGVICGFRGLIDLSIGGNVISSEALARSELPPNVECLDLCAITLADSAIESVCRCRRITTLNVNYCDLSLDALVRLSELPNLQMIEALGADSTPDFAKTLSRRRPDVLLRLRNGIWQDGECRRPPFPSERV